MSIVPKPELDPRDPPLAWSRFLSDWVAANPGELEAPGARGILGDAEACAGWVADAKPLRSALADEPAAFPARLRRFRNARMAAIAWCDLTGAAHLEQTLAALSSLADACVAAALAHAESVLGVEGGKGQQPNSLIIIGMGKLGGRELNFSSDIDLIFAYREGDTDDAGAQQRYQRLAQRLIATLCEKTADGFVFRVDTRLRPFGEAGALVASIDAMENYYQTHGRGWERYAWIKARPVAGDLDGGRELIARLRPFVYRRYLDYGAFESIRDMKALIEKEVARGEMRDNIKLGRGGIREIEFIAQGFQLIRGGHEPRLQDSRLLPVLAYLGEIGHLPVRVATELREGYGFLRRLENRLQMWADRQTHDLPSDAPQQSALAAAMGYADWPALAAALTDWRRRLHAHFEQVFAAPHVEEPDAGPLGAAWSGIGDEDRGREALGALGYLDPAAAWSALAELRKGALFAGLGHRGRRRLAQLVPLMAAAATIADHPDQALIRVIGVLARIVGRTAYVDLLVENPAALSRLIALCGASPWITGQIRAQPVLLDSLLNPRVLFHPPTEQELPVLLETALAAAPEDGLERRMEALRHFHHEQTLRVAAADVSNSMPLMSVSDRLTALAEALVGAALKQTWRELTGRHGSPRLTDGRTAPFLVLGYGKLGGLELGYGSDLDLVFVHGGSDDASTDGERSLSHSAFFLRLAQRVIHLLSTRTGAGRVYEVDTRLRPNGRSGLLVVSMPGFARYQRERAWTWEHQALVRARPVAGDAELAAAFTELRAEILGRKRDPAELRRAVTDMRDRMRAELDRGGRAGFNLKHGRGGLVDIEFLAQFAVLHWAHRCPELLIFTDTLRALETLESAALLPYEDARQLTHAYRAYRRELHAAALQEAPGLVPRTAYRGERAAVIVAWRRLLR